MNTARSTLESQLPMLRRRERMAFWWALGFVVTGLFGIGMQVVSYFVTQRAVSSFGPVTPTPQQLAEEMSGGIAIAMGGFFFLICGGAGLLISLLAWLVTMRRRRQVEGRLQAIG